jgi:hypothetical protein
VMAQKRKHGDGDLDFLVNGGGVKGGGTRPTLGRTEEARMAMKLGLLVEAQRPVKLTGLWGLLAEDGEGEAHRTVVELEEWRRGGTGRRRRRESPNPSSG